MAINRFEKLKEYANKRQSEIMNNAKLVMSMEITTDFNYVDEVQPSITYKITEAIVPSDFDLGVLNYDK